MSHPVTTLCLREKVGRIVDVLQSNYYSGYPVVDDYDPLSVEYILCDRFYQLVCFYEELHELKRKCSYFINVYMYIHSYGVYYERLYVRVLLIGMNLIKWFHVTVLRFSVQSNSDVWYSPRPRHAHTAHRHSQKQGQFTVTASITHVHVLVCDILPTTCLCLYRVRTIEAYVF